MTLFGNNSLSLEIYQAMFSFVIASFSDITWATSALVLLFGWVHRGGNRPTQRREEGPVLPKPNCITSNTILLKIFWDTWAWSLGCHSPHPRGCSDNCKRIPHCSYQLSLCSLRWVLHQHKYCKHHMYNLSPILTVSATQIQCRPPLLEVLASPSCLRILHNRHLLAGGILWVIQQFCSLTQLWLWIYTIQPCVLTHASCHQG